MYVILIGSVSRSTTIISYLHTQKRTYCIRLLQQAIFSCVNKLIALYHYITTPTEYHKSNVRFKALSVMCWIPGKTLSGKLHRPSSCKVSPAVDCVNFFVYPITNGGCWGTVR